MYLKNGLGLYRISFIVHIHDIYLSFISFHDFFIITNHIIQSSHQYASHILPLIYLFRNLMLLNTRIPPILRSRMISRRPRLSLLAIHILPIRPLGHSIVLMEESSPAQFGDEQVDNVLECAGFDGVGLSYVSKDLSWYDWGGSRGLQC